MRARDGCSLMASQLTTRQQFEQGAEPDLTGCCQQLYFRRHVLAQSFHNRHTHTPLTLCITLLVLLTQHQFPTSLTAPQVV